MKIMNCTFLPSAKFDAKNVSNLVGQWPHTMHMP